MMAAATRARRRAAGKLLEDQNKNPSTLQKELAKIDQKKKQKTDESVREESVPAQSESESNTIDMVAELPYAEVQPLPLVARGVPVKAKNLKPNVGDVTKWLTPKSDDTTKSLKFKADDDVISKLMAEPGFKNRAPLQLDERAKDLVHEALRNPISITTEDLLNVSEPMRQELKKLLIKKRLEKKSVAFTAELDPVDDVGTAEPKSVDTISVERLPEATYEVLAEDTNGMSKGSVVVSDPVMQYLNALAPGEEPKAIIVAAESHALRTVYPLINRVGEVESLLDPGSQIVSMSKTVAVTLEVPWDPDITVHMQSANNTLEKTLGLAKNVPFLFGTITVYLQVHVVENAAYKVLLGRPFDIVTESIVKNAKDGSQSLTLTDPNTGVRCVMHTHERGKIPTVLQRCFKSDFQALSMN
jgi:hypothetical protein